MIDIKRIDKGNQTTLYDYKLKKTGSISELVKYEKPIIRGYERRHDTLRKANRTSANEQNAKRARRAVHDLVNTNLTEFTKMVTLTYAKTILDYEQVSKDFKVYQLNLKRAGFQLPYLAITEHQKERGKKEGNLGSLHLHIILFSDVYLPFKQLKQAWGNRGSVHIEKLSRAKNKGAYVAKYITKETLPPDKKAYRTSRNIKRPEIVSGLDSLNVLYETIENQFELVAQYDYSIYGSVIQETGEYEKRNEAKVLTFKNEHDKNFKMKKGVNYGKS